jgi:hypothetical protein
MLKAYFEYYEHSRTPLALEKDAPYCSAFNLPRSEQSSREVTDTLIDATRDPERLIRVTAVDGLDRLAPDEKLSVVAPLLSDPIRAVRIQAALVMTGAPFNY